MEPRDLADTLDQMLVLIPDKLPEHKRLRAMLGDIQLSATCTAPEAMARRWQQVDQLLWDWVAWPMSRHAGDWEMEVWKIWAGTDKTLKLYRKRRTAQPK